MPTITEWQKCHGIKSARQAFGLSDHLVFTVSPGRYVFAVCGRWRASQPLGINHDIENALEQLRSAIGHLHETEEYLINWQTGDDQ